ncbi:MAG: hypothetical protein V9F82_10525 [Dermatophilaceae bacterium]
MAAQDTVVCVTCGRGLPPSPAGTEAAMLAWTKGLEDGRVVWTCGQCSREYLRAIESKLDSAWW